MRNRKSFLTLGIMVLVLFLGVGYAVVSSVYLNIGGTASVNDSSLNVEITNAVASTNIADKTVDFSHTLSTNKLSSEFTLNGLVLDEEVDITYTVTNNERDVDTELSSKAVYLGYSNSEFFSASYDITDSTTDLANGDNTMTVIVTIKLIKTPVTEEDSSAQVSVNITANPLGNDSSSESTKAIYLNYGEKYYLTTFSNVDLREYDGTWFIFNEDGTLNQGDYIISFPSSGYTYSQENIYNSELLTYSASMNVSSDGKFITMNGNDNSIMGMLVLETEYNTLSDVLVKFGEKYVCKTDNMNSGMIDSSMQFYPDGSSLQFYTNDVVDYMSEGSWIYSQSEIHLLDAPENVKFVISDDGKTLTYMYEETVALVFELES